MKDEQLYDHYKETNELCRNAQKQRDRYFFLICVAIFILLMLSAYPSESILMISDGLKEAVGVTPTVGLHVIQSFGWMLYLWITLRYYQRSIYVERTYKYIESLEEKLGITREGTAYEEDYPAILNMIHGVYQLFFPIVTLLSTVVKIIWEYSNQRSIAFYCLDTVVAILIIVTTILYWLCIHPLPKLRKKKKKG